MTTIAELTSRRGRRPLSPMAWLRQILRVRRERHRLAELDDAALFDIGISREQAKAEAARPMWDVPAHWRG